MNKTLPQVNETLCTRCGLCVEACSCRAVELGERGPVFACPDVSVCEAEDSLECDCLCEDICPAGAISCAFEIVMQDQPPVRPPDSGDAKTR